MDDEQQRRAVDAALLPIAASLGGAGVTGVHWLPDREGRPVVWLHVRTEIERVALQTHSWVLPQVQIVLTRLSLPREVIRDLRLEFTSDEADDQLFDE